MTNNNGSNENNSNSFNFDRTNLSPKIIDCPSSISDPALQDESQWIAYTDYHGAGSLGNFLFHGNRETFLENRRPSLENPQQECVFDSKGELIDEAHPYAGMGGTANYYSDSFDHTFVDPGGIAERGLEGFATSMEYYYGSTSETFAESIADEANAL